jgi:hypothetical protein
LTETPPLKVGLIVEPTPFTHVSGYSNRYKEMLTYLKKADDEALPGARAPAAPAPAREAFRAQGCGARRRLTRRRWARWRS